MVSAYDMLRWLTQGFMRLSHGGHSTHEVGLGQEKTWYMENNKCSGLDENGLELFRGLCGTVRRCGDYVDCDFFSDDVSLHPDVKFSHFDNEKNGSQGQSVFCFLWTWKSSAARLPNPRTKMVAQLNRMAFGKGL